MKKIDPKDLYSITHYEYGVPYSGSRGGMRFWIARNPLERVFGKKDAGEANIEVVIWKGPFAIDVTTEEKTSKLFEFSNEGIEEAAKWLNEQYEASKDVWEQGTIANSFKIK